MYMRTHIRARKGFQLHCFFVSLFTFTINPLKHWSECVNNNFLLILYKKFFYI